MKYTAPHSLPIIEPAKDLIKESGSTSALARDFNDLSSATSSAISAEGMRAELAAAADAAAAAATARSGAAADATNKYGALPGRVSATEDKNATQDTTIANIGTRVGAVETIGGLAPGDVSDATVASVVSNPGSASRVALDSGYSKIKVVSSVVSIPTDYPTLQSAIDALSLDVIKQGATIAISIEAGHQPASGIIITGGDYSQFSVTSTDKVVTVDPTFTGPFIRGEHAYLPTLACMVDMQDLGEQGYAALYGSRGYVRPHCGTRNSGTRGCHVAGSSVWAPSTEFSGSGDRNLHITGGAFFEGDAGNFSANKSTGNAGDRAVYVSRQSRASLMGATVTDAMGDAAIQAIRSQVSAESADVSRAETVGIKASGGATVSFKNGKANNCGTDAINVSGASTVDAESAELNDATRSAINCTTGSNVNAWGAKALRSGSTSVISSTGSSINARDMDATGHESLNAYGIANGSTINANGAIGTKSNSVNTISSYGIIFG